MLRVLTEIRVTCSENDNKRIMPVISQWLSKNIHSLTENQVCFRIRFRIGCHWGCTKILHYHHVLRPQSLPISIAVASCGILLFKNWICGRYICGNIRKIHQSTRLSNKRGRLSSCNLRLFARFQTPIKNYLRRYVFVEQLHYGGTQIEIDG